MTIRPSHIGNKNRFGKDHFMLADWRISVAQFQTRKKQDGTKVDHAEFVIDRQGESRQRVTLESPSTIGLPTAGDEDFIIALLFLAKEQGFESDVVRFLPSQLLAIMGLASTKNNYERLKNALKRLRAVTITYESIWYSRATRAVEPVLITGILAEAKLVFRRGRRAKSAEPDSYVQWTRHFFTSLQQGNLTNLNLDLYFGWKRPGSKHLHRHLNKVWYAGKKPKVYERDLKELACGHLGMTNCKDLKRNFQQIINELEHQQYLLPLDDCLRFQKVRTGVWRVRLELHPQQHSMAKPREGELSAGKEQSACSNTEKLVLAYHTHRFGCTEYTPKPHELKHACSLLKVHDIDGLLRALPVAAEAASASYRGQDCHFGAAVPFIEKALDHVAKRDQSRQSSATTPGDTNGERQAQMDTRSRRLAEWRMLTASQQKAYFQKAIANASSDLVRSRLRRSRDFDNPPTEVLAVMAIAE